LNTNFGISHFVADRQQAKRQSDDESQGGRDFAVEFHYGAPCRVNRPEINGYRFEEIAFSNRAPGFLVSGSVRRHRKSRERRAVLGGCPPMRKGGTHS
jgi:hypothetical protein